MPRPAYATCGESQVVVTACLVLLLATLRPLPAHGTTYMMVVDEDLVDGAALVAVVRVVGVRALEVGGRIVTDYEVRPRVVYKGQPPSPLVTLRRPGGMLADGRYTMIPGLPELVRGQQALVFMIERPDGTFGFEHHLLGLFRISDIAGRRVAYRFMDSPVESLNDPRRQRYRASLERAHRARDRDGFGNWIRDRAAGAEIPGDYYLEEGYIQLNAMAPFTLFDDGAGNSAPPAPRYSRPRQRGLRMAGLRIGPSSPLSASVCQRRARRRRLPRPIS